MQKGNRTTMWVIVIIVVLAIVFVLATWNKAPMTEQPGMEATTTVTTSNNTPSTVDSTGVNAGPVSLSYEAALNLYKDSRIQVTTECQASPSNGTFKNGTKIMLDNRSAIAHNFKLGTNFTVKAYGFKIVTLSSATLPATWLLDCDLHQNIATIGIQK